MENNGRIKDRKENQILLNMKEIKQMGKEKQNGKYNIKSNKRYNLLLLCIILSQGY